MPSLFLTEQGSQLRKVGDRLLVVKDDQELLEIECFKIDSVFLLGGVEITTPALTKLLQRGITLVLLTRDGRLKGRLVPPLAKNSLLRATQYERRGNPDFCLGVAKRHVGAKITSCCELLARQARNHPELPLASHIVELERYEQSVPRSESIRHLRGLEGMAARMYFEGFAKCCRRELQFPGRRRRPPTDPINALLSLGYVMLGAQIAAVLEGIGFDPYLGFYHQLAYGRASLALDVLEEFRIIVDQLVLRLTNLGTLSSNDFETGQTADVDPAEIEPAAVRLKPEPFRKFVREFGQRMEGPVTDQRNRTSSKVAAAVRRQAERLAAAVTSGEAYEPFIVRP